MNSFFTTCRTWITIVAIGLTTLSTYANRPLEISIGKVRLPDGSVVEQAVVVGRNPTGVNIRHATGVTFVQFRSLPSVLRTKLGYDPKAEKAWYDAIARQRRAEAMAKQRAEAAVTQKEQLAKREKEIEKFQRHLEKIDKNSVGGGTGFFITPDGHLITNEHVVRSARSKKNSKIKIVWMDHVLDAKILALDKEKDLAVLLVERPEKVAKFPCLPLSRKPVANMGTSVFTVGFPQPWLFGWTPKLTEGTISSVRGMDGEKMNYQLMMPIHGGNSGGAVVDFHTGEVVGVIKSKINETYTAQYIDDSIGSVSYARKVQLLADVFKKIKDFPYGRLRPPAKTERHPERARIISYVRESTVAINILAPPRRPGIPFDE